jgi:hypothetical protein
LCPQAQTVPSFLNATELSDPALMAFVAIPSAAGSQLARIRHQHSDKATFRFVYDFIRFSPEI